MFAFLISLQHTKTHLNLNPSQPIPFEIKHIFASSLQSALFVLFQFVFFFQFTNRQQTCYVTHPVRFIHIVFYTLCFYAHLVRVRNCTKRSAEMQFAPRWRHIAFLLANLIYFASNSSVFSIYLLLVIVKCSSVCGCERWCVSVCDFGHLKSFIIIFFFSHTGSYNPSYTAWFNLLKQSKSWSVHACRSVWICNHATTYAASSLWYHSSAGTLLICYGISVWLLVGIEPLYDQQINTTSIRVCRVRAPYWLRLFCSSCEWHIWMKCQFYEWHLRYFSNWEYVIVFVLYKME